MLILNWMLATHFNQVGTGAAKDEGELWRTPKKAPVCNITRVNRWVKGDGITGCGRGICSATHKQG